MGIYWNTLGTAQYRNGQCRAAIRSLEESRRLQGGNSYDDFFLAMAHWQLGEKGEASRRLR